MCGLKLEERPIAANIGPKRPTYMVVLTIHIRLSTGLYLLLQTSVSLNNCSNFCSFLILRLEQLFNSPEEQISDFFSFHCFECLDLVFVRVLMNTCEVMFVCL